MTPLVVMSVTIAGCSKTSSKPDPIKDAAVSPSSDARASKVEPVEARDARDPDADLVTAEMAAHAAAKPILDEHCASCHTSERATSKKAKKALKHFVMDSYPYGGHHVSELGTSIRKVLGLDGEEATMPKDDPGSITGDELQAIVAWTKAWDAASAAGVGHHATPTHDHHPPKSGGHTH